jgi:hypothetical protein
MHPETVKKPNRKGMPMAHLADHFKFMLMDNEAAIAARLVSTGANYWRTPGGGMSVARNGTVISLGRRQAGQVSSLLSIHPGEAPASLDSIPAHLSNLLADDEHAGPQADIEWRPTHRPSA